MKAIYIRSPDVYERLALRPIAEAMTKPVVTVPAGMILSKALQYMVRSHLRHLVVVREDGVCLGTVTDRMLTAAWAEDASTLLTVPVVALLEREPATVPVTAKVIDAAKLMRSRQVDAVVVTDPDGLPAGIVTGSDLVALLAR